MTAGLDPFAGAGTPLGYLLLDVFSPLPLKGNQLAVFADGSTLDTPAMQAIAGELKLSETVFLLPAQDVGDARARIFTPVAELPFAGHPLLGAAVVVALASDLDKAVVETGAGPIEVAVTRGPGRVHAGEMSQPVPEIAPFAAAAELLEALGVERSELPVEEYTNGPRHVVVTLASDQAVAALAPDVQALRRLPGDPLCVSCIATSDRGVKTRMFAPALGVEEDPATGSAAGPIAVHCARHGLTAFGREIEIRQGEEIARPSLLRARADGSAQRIEAVKVGGDAVILGRGELFP